MPISPVIVIPGIKASDLHDEYELPPEAVWSTVLKRRHERVTLHPENPRYELLEPARVAPRGPFPLIYEDLIEELRDGLSENEPGPVPVFPFGYDWRMPLDRTEKRLAAFVEEVIDRTLLIRHYRDDEVFRWNPTVTLIGHSMGGLIIAGYIQSHTGRLVDKVVTLGTPFRGSYEAIVKVATGTSELSDDSGKARERRMARMTPALYHLLPESVGLVGADGGMEVNFFDPDAWQPNVTQTIDRQMRDQGVAGDRRFSPGELFFGQMLEQARVHRTRISGLRLPGPGEGAAPAQDEVADRDWLAIAGVDSTTRVGLRVALDENGAPRFDLRSGERRNDWDSDVEGDRRATGDGTVPLAGALPPFLDESRLVCVTPGDFGYWEIRDRLLTTAAGFHGLLPKMNMLHRLILRFLLGSGDRYRNTWGRRVPGVTEWQPPLDLREKE